MNQFTRLLITLCFSLQAFPSFSQDEKKLHEAIEVFKEDKYDKAIDMLRKALGESTESEHWNLLVEMCHIRFQYTNDPAMALLPALGVEGRTKMDNPASFHAFVDACREACLKSPSTKGSQMLRTYFVDHNPDKEIPKEAKELYNEGEKYFGEKDYEKSRDYYGKALKAYPGYYKACIYLGDSYWYLENMDSAVHYFQKGILMNPDLLEPRKYLVDALAYKKENDHAIKECITTFFIYPDESMFLKFRDLLKRKNQSLDRNWVQRKAPVNQAGKTAGKTKDKAWAAYQSALKDVSSYASEDGLLKENSITKQKYLEVYSWEKMLASQKAMPDELKFAEKMRQEGYLDCYVFISLFHHDLYPQYKDFVAGNKNRINTYIETYMIKK